MASICNDEQVAIRGFAVSASPGNPQFLQDGIHGPSIFDFTNIARVEVVKGPSSFLYGQVVPGGIVNVITKSPQARFAASGYVSYGSAERRSPRRCCDRRTMGTCAAIPAKCTAFAYCWWKTTNSTGAGRRTAPGGRRNRQRGLERTGGA